MLSTLKATSSLFATAAFSFCSIAFASDVEHLTPNDAATISPLTWRDDKTGILFYVESDGRHVSAIAPDGTILWHRNPFVDSAMKPYRFSKPLIVSIGPASVPSRKEHLTLSGEMRSKPGEYERVEGKLYLSFNSSQFGYLDMTTGDFQMRGQD